MQSLSSMSPKRILSWSFLSGGDRTKAPSMCKVTHSTFLDTKIGELWIKHGQWMADVCIYAHTFVYMYTKNNYCFRYGPSSIDTASENKPPQAKWVYGEALCNAMHYHAVSYHRIVSFMTISRANDHQFTEMVTAEGQIWTSASRWIS